MEDENDGFTVVQTKQRGTSNRGRGNYQKPPRAPPKPKAPVQRALGPGDSLGAGDSYIVLDLMKDISVDGKELVDIVFERLREEVQWGIMHHRGGEVPRMVAVEGVVEDDGSFPIYRHPADASPPLLPFSQTVSLIRDAVQRAIQHPVNHVLIQHYRSGTDYISEHSDKTIDVIRGSSIVNVSLGAQRAMTLRMKKDGAAAIKAASSSLSSSNPDDPASRPQQRIPLPHGSLFVMGPRTNAQWLHGISQDKRLPAKVKHTGDSEPDPRYKNGPELAYNGERISLTFRHIGTFLTKDPASAAGVVGRGIGDEAASVNGDVQRIWGQGARSKTRDRARPVVLAGNQGKKLIWAFGKENGESGFDWDRWYGEGFDVLHFSEESA